MAVATIDAINGIALAHFDRIAALDAGERAAIGRIVGSRHVVPAGEAVVREGELRTHLTILLDGFAYRAKSVLDGGRQIVGLYLAGDVPDLEGLAQKWPDHSVVALGTCHIARVSHASLLQSLREVPSLGRLLWKLMAANAAIGREWMVSLGRRTALQRTAHLLCEVEWRLRGLGLSGARGFEFPVTQLDLGDMLGLSVVHTNRTVQELRAAGLIQWSGHVVRILDEARLRALAEFDDGYLAVGLTMETL